ncbi:MAG: dTDP-glucose 4,6-dehydratase [Nitrospirae bacterium]|nr:MAG: dTDP-glucose 4,6-dehydratase [Nitrospirota bacterium]
MKILVTGGCGFIGSNFIRHMLRSYPQYEIVNLDALTYAGNPENLRDVKDRKNYRFIKGRVEDQGAVREAIKGCDAVVHFAAESHVDRSIKDAQPFLITNIIGLQVLMDSALSEGVKRFVHISTDEVYGCFETEEGSFTEESPLMPNSPYAASKAGGDLLLRAYIKTYGLNAIVVRPSNNYGPYQFPEKLIPLMVTNLIDGLRVPVYGKGLNIRDWLFVEDTARAVDLILHKGVTGEVYNVGGGNERRNIDVVKRVLQIMGLGEEYIEFVPDRPGHDFRYSIDSSKIKRKLGWEPEVSFDEGIERTVRWYRENEWWWRPLKERLGRESRGFWSNKK